MSTLSDKRQALKARIHETMGIFAALNNKLY